MLSIVLKKKQDEKKIKELHMKTVSDKPFVLGMNAFKCTLIISYDLAHREVPRLFYG